MYRRIDDRGKVPVKWMNGRSKEVNNRGVLYTK